MRRYPLVMHFTKMQALGNDYVVLDGFREPSVLELDDAPGFARAVCDRRRGVGADGVIVLAPAERVGGVPGAGSLPGSLPGAGADCAMLIINADGSAGGMCGNGLRCAAKLLVDRGHAMPDEFGRIGIHLSGRLLRVHAHRAELGDGLVDSATVDMGPPSFEPEAVGLDLGRVDRREDDGGVVVDGVAVHCVSMGNPHAVHFCAPGESAEAMLFTVGPRLEVHGAFRDRTNVHFVRVVNEGEAEMLSWERGVGHTLACGSGACAVLAAGVRTGRLGRRAVLRSPGGDLVVRWESDDAGIMQTGPAEVVFEGEWVQVPAPTR